MRLTLLSVMAKLLHIRFKVDGMPYGAASYSRPKPSEVRR